MTAERLAEVLGRVPTECVQIGQTPSVQHWRVRAGGKSYFVKSGSIENTEEARGLAALADSGLRTPKVIAREADLLALEWIETEIPMPPFWRRLGRELAEMHRRPHASFGFEIDNHLGGTPQSNPESTGPWAEYFWTHRLSPLIQATGWNAPGLRERTLELLDGVGSPSLVHGDLWSGNVLCGPYQTPYFIDPAPYRGHREVDLAMSEMFGGFDARFYAGYDEVFPREPDYARRRPLYNLYHLLNHWLLFGGSYRLACEAALVEISRQGGADSRR